MNGPLPSLALEMSMEGIALHQLAFDGHWHELAHVGLNDAALREKMANMREIAQRLEGRRLKVRVWLPSDQIIRKTAEIAGDDPRNRDDQAREVLQNITPHSGAEFAVATNTPAQGDASCVAGVRCKTMHEAAAFAKSHGFKAVVYSSREPIDGFVDKPYFTLPPNRMRAIALWGIGAAPFASVVAGGVAFKIADPYQWWEKPPEVADFAPFQNPNLAEDRSNDNVLPANQDLPTIVEFGSIGSQTLREPLPYIPQRQLNATALEFINEPAALRFDDFDITYSTMVEDARFSLPGDLGNIAAPDSADRPPALGLYNVLSTFADMQVQTDQPDQHNTALSALAPVTGHELAPQTVANIRFVLEPIPSMAVTMSHTSLLEIGNSFGVTIDDITPNQPIVLAETQVVDIIRGLPEILPKLRSGREIPPQVAVVQIQPTVTVVETVPADAETIAAAARGFQIIQGRPEIVPARRAVPPVVEEPVIAETVEEVAPPETETASVTLPEFSGEIVVINAQPELLPLLRSGNAIPEPGSQIPEDTPSTESPSDETVAAPEVTIVTLDETVVAPDETIAETVDPALAAAIAVANDLRPLRRPQSIIEMTAPADPMLSDAAPASANLPSHRNAEFDANAARIAELASNRPRAVAPVVPVDPQTVTLPTTASVARAATIEDGINLRKTSLIGIFGTADNREVLIRLSSGRIIQLGLGDTFSGWQLVAISDDSIRIQKGSRTEILRLPG